MNKMKEKLINIFNQIKRENPTMSLDEILYTAYNIDNSTLDFSSYRQLLLNANNIDEIKYYTKNVNTELIQYIEEKIFPKYAINDQAHGIVHIKEVIRRAFALNDTFKLNLKPNMIYAMAAYHDLGKHENHEIHEKIAAQRFIEDKTMQEFFTEDERKIIMEAIEDHRSSKEDEPRSTYGKLISSADRNTRIEIVFIRSFFVGKERMPNVSIEEYLEYTHKRLLKKYSEDNPENMFYEDQTYKVFLKDMRSLLKDKEKFKNKYCIINNIISRTNNVEDEEGHKEYNNT